MIYKYIKNNNKKIINIIEKKLRKNVNKKENILKRRNY